MLKRPSAGSPRHASVILLPDFCRLSLTSVIAGDGGGSTGNSYMRTRLEGLVSVAHWG